MLGVRAGLVGPVVGDLQFPGDVVVVGGQRLQLLLQGHLHCSQLVVDVGDLGDLNGLDIRL